MMCHRKNEKHKANRVFIAAAAFCACVAMAFATGCSSGTANIASQEIAGRYNIQVSIAAEGYDSVASTPAIVHVVQTSGNGGSSDKMSDFYHAIDLNSDAMVPVDNAGNYELSFISPINADGSIYEMPSPQKVAVEAPAEQQKSNNGNEHADTPVFTLESLSAKHIAADDVTEEQIDSLMASISLAVENGDTQLVKDAKNLSAKAKKNIKNNPHYTAQQATEGDDAPTQSGNASSEKSQPSTGSQGSSDSNGGSTGGGQGAGSTPVSDPTPTPEPAHVHTWITCSEIVGYDYYIQCSCGAHFSSTGEWTQHSKSNLMAGNSGHGSYSTHDDAIYSYYEVCSGCGERR